MLGLSLSAGAAHAARVAGTRPWPGGIGLLALFVRAGGSRLSRQEWAAVTARRAALQLDNLLRFSRQFMPSWNPRYAGGSVL